MGQCAGNPAHPVRRRGTAISYTDLDKIIGTPHYRHYFGKPVCWSGMFKYIFGAILTVAGVIVNTVDSKQFSCGLLEWKKRRKC
jgi:hypothetical protein